MPKATKHILVIRLSAMGDVAMVVPVLRALITQNSDINLTILTGSPFISFFRGMERVNVVPVETKGEHKGVYGLYKLARRLNKDFQFYAIADLHSVLRSKILKQFLNCARFVSIDKGRQEKRDLTSGKIFKQLKTTHQRYADVFRSLDYKVDLSSPIFPEPISISPKIHSITGEKTEKWIGIAPFAAHEGKMYPLERMEQVVSEISSSFTVLLFGGGIHEEAILNKWESKYPNTKCTAGKLTLNEQLDVISNLDLMLSMDSGNAHIAAMLGIKVITIWGVTHPYAGFAPFNQPQDYMLLADRQQYPKIPSSVYGNRYPEGYELAAGSVSEEIVISKIQEIVNNKKGTS